MKKLTCREFKHNCVHPKTIGLLDAEANSIVLQEDKYNNQLKSNVYILDPSTEKLVAILDHNRQLKKIWIL